MPRNKYHATDLFRIADSQQGYFTSGQAKEAGYDPRNATYHVRNGNWIRESRGIYRLQNYPVSRDGELVVWSLWSRNQDEVPQGVYSHQSALAIHDLTDLMPAKYHMTVPLTFRRTAQIPKALVLHSARLKAEEIEEKQGFAVTAPLRTIQDLIADNSVAIDTIRHALETALRRGILTTRTIQEDQSQEMRQLLRSVG